MQGCFVDVVSANDQNTLSKKMQTKPLFTWLQITPFGYKNTLMTIYIISHFTVQLAELLSVLRFDK
jgi:hypothetical protein